MKKVLVAVFLGLLLSSNAYAGCKSDIQFSWYKDDGFARLKFYNKSGKFIRITDYEILDSDRDTIREGEAYRFFKNPTGVFVGSNQSVTYGVSLGNNINYARFANYDCRYQKPYEKTMGEKAEDLADSVGDTIKGWFDDD